ncbi:unnamed protein product [Cochlearia groenlandica]
MQGGGRDPFNFGGGGGFGGPFGGGGFGGPFGGGPNNGFPNMMSTFFGGRDPFDDPFFTQPFGGGNGMMQPGFFGPNMDPFAGMRNPSGFIENHQPPVQRRSHGPIIEEIDSDDEKEGEEEDKEKKRRLGKHRRSSSEAETEDARARERRNRQIQSMNVNAMINNGQQQQPQTRSFSFQSSTVTYGGHNGNYYTSSKTRRTGSDGLTLEESKEANTATREAAHRISRGLHNKGHTVARKLTSDGRVDTTQTLHNLEEDELPGFEQSWSGNATTQLPGLSGSFGSKSAKNKGFEQKDLPSAPTSPAQPPRRKEQGRREPLRRERPSRQPVENHRWLPCG